MKRIKIAVLFTLILICSCDNSEDSSESDMDEPIVQGEFIDDWTYSVYPGIADNFYLGEFRMWVPEETEKLKAILILAGSYNSNSLGLVLHESWQDYARNENLALLAVNLKSSSTGSYYGWASGGSGNALIKALKHISEKHNLENMNTLPFLARGYSAGGVFSYYMSEFLPERLIAFANIRGGAVDITSSENKNVLGLMILGENDIVSRNINMKNAVVHKRMEGGLWCYITEPNVDHFGRLNNSDELIKHFFSKALEERLKSDNTNELEVITESTGWLGDNVSKEYFLFDKFPNSKNEASWLIDENFAEYWQNFQLK